MGLASLLVGLDAHAATYYTAPTGSDSNSCAAAISQSTPKRNIMGASGGISCLKQGGDALLIRAGTYNETITNGSLYSNTTPSWPSGSSWSNAIRVAAYSGEKVSVLGVAFGDCCSNAALPQLRYWIIEGFTVMSGGGVRFNSHIDHIRFINNDITAPTDSGIVLGASAYNVDLSPADAIEIINNKIHDGPSDCAPGNRSYGIYMNKVSKTLIEGNEFFNMPGGGIHMYNAGNLPRAKGTIIRNNSIHHNNWCLSSNIGGIWIGDADDTLIYNNLIYSNGAFDGSKGFGSGISFGISSNTKVFNNVIYGNQADGLNSGGVNALGLAIRNNIIWSNRYKAIYSSSTINTNQDHNLCNAGCAINADPQFVSAGTFDFHLKSGSPAIDQGVNLYSGGVTMDFARTARPQSGLFELGAYEYGSTSVPPPILAAAGPVAHWKLDEASGTTAADASGNGNIATLAGGPVSVPGKLGAALRFDGINDKASAPNTSLLNPTTALSLAAWVNPSIATTTWRAIMAKNYTFFLYSSIGNAYCGAGGIMGGVVTGGATQTACLATPLLANTWVHLALTYDGTTLRLYNNGAQAASAAVTGAVSAGTGTFDVGGSKFGEYFPGAIDDARVYNRALSASEIQALATVAANPMPAAPRGLSLR